MKQFASIVSILCFLLINSSLWAQNSALITTINPGELYVCGDDTMSVTIQNTGTGTLNNVIATVVLPAGIEYIAGTVNGAVEQNISNLSAPKFNIGSIGIGLNQTFNIRIIATCSLVETINSGQLFTNKIDLTYTGGTETVSSVNYKVETGLAAIVSATPQTVAAEIGEMPIRTYVIRNTRLGPIKRIEFTDNHFPGFNANIAGAINQTNNPVLFTASLDGSFFSAFGDGDELFELNEEITVLEKLTITDCGTPPFTNPSLIRIGWGCNTDVCQYDSTNLDLDIKTSTKNPDLKFESKYGYPTDYCTNQSSTNEVLVINNGLVAAENVVLDIRNGFFDTYTGVDTSTFEYNAGAGWIPIYPAIATPIELSTCNITYYSRSVISIPLVPEKDTVLLRYKFFTCFPECDQVLIPPYIFTFYEKKCPVGANVTDSVGFVIDSVFLGINQLTRFNFMGCMEENETYALNFTSKSARFLTDTTYFQARFTLPKGISWDNSCVPPTIEGKSPVYTSFVTDPTTGTTEIVLAFKLPFNSDSINMPFCLNYTCMPDNPCMETLGMISQGGGSSIAFPIECDKACGLKTLTQASISFTPDAGSGCGLTACHLFMLMTHATCLADGAGSGSGIPAELTVEMKTYRINYGLKDTDDNRIADDNTKPDLNQIRLDRYLPGDTLRFDLKGVVTFGTVPDFQLRVLTESLQSDFGLLDGDQYNIAGGRTRLTNIDSLKEIRVLLRVKPVNGAEYECNLSLSDYKNQNFIQMQAVNIQPPQTIDRLITMYREYPMTFSSCSPTGQNPTVGDSVFFIYEYVFKPNFTPAKAGGPPPALINLRNVIWNRDYAWTYPDLIGWPRFLSQYSGYVQSRSFPKHTIRPCDTSAQQIPFSYGIRIARGNMFPFEVREIAQIDQFRYRMPTDVTLLSASSDLTLQEGISWFNDLPIPWSVAGQNYDFDYANSIFEFPLDEGYNLRTNYRYEESCSFLGPDTAQVTYDVQYPEGFPGNEIATYTRRDGTGFLDASPRLKANFNQTILNMSSSNFELDFVLRNLRAAPSVNTWMYVQPLNGTISGVELITLPNGTSAPGLANLFQLGELGSFAQQGLRIKGVNSNCEGLKLRIIFGWDCDPVTNAFASSCGRDTVDLDLRLKNAVLELDIINQPLDVPLCEPSDYFTYEVSNANDGNGLGITSTVKLPPGLSVVPGSSQVQYPAPSGPWVNIANPTIAPGNIALWKMADILPVLTMGLPGFTTAPNNAYRVRFKVIAECGFVANAQPIYGVEGVQPCGSLTNSLRKPDEPINLEGVSAAYGVDINLSPVSSNPLSCGQDYEIAIQLLLQGSPNASDSVYITLPAGVSYLTGSYLPGQNAPAGTPLQVGQTLQFPFNAGLAAGSVVKFNIKLKYNETAGCLDQFIVAQTRQKTNGFCALIGQNCGIYIATGEALLQVPTSNPDLKLASFAPGTSTSGGGFNFEAVLENPGTVSASNPVLQFWIDQNGNGVPDAGEQLLQTVNYNQAIPPGGTAAQSGTLNVPLESLCKLLAVLPAQENCACSPKYFPIDGLVVENGTLARCAVESVMIGVDSIGGHSYNWQPTGLLSCTNCANTTFIPNSTVTNGDFFTFVLFETAGTCTIEHRYEIRFGEALGVTTPNQVICKGDSVILQASPGGTYQWSGPGVVAGAQQQVLFPTTTTTYSVTVTLAAGCTGSDVVTVSVLEPTLVNLPPLKTCAGVPVQIFGEPKTDAGTYCRTVPKANGCDSTVCVTLSVVPVAGNSIVNTCGDSVEIFPGQLEMVAGQYCKTFTNSAGCDSTHCVTLKVAPKVTLDPVNEIRIAQGASTTLQGPAGYATYAWTPPAGLSCTDCQNPTATPTASTTYNLYVTNNGGCGDSVKYRILVLPPCFEQIKVPNAFTPNSGGYNDSLQVIFPAEGHFETVVGLQVYNRWGERIFQSSSKPYWDGTVDGKPAPMDVYIFIFDVECNGERRRLIEREVTLIR